MAIIDQFCLVRCRDAGVHCGIVKEVSGRSVLLYDARRLYEWSEHFTLNEVALKGGGRNARIPLAVKEILLLEACEVILCTPEAEADLRRSRNNTSGSTEETGG